MKSRVIALSAISASFCALLLTLGAYFEVVDLISVTVATVFIILPYYYGSKKGCILAGIVGGVIAMLISGFNFISLVFPFYFLFTMPFTLLNVLCSESKFIKSGVGFLVKILWTLAVGYFLLWYYTYVIGVPITYDFTLFGKTFDLSAKENIYYYFLLAYGLLLMVFFLVYDRFIVVTKKATDKLLKRILKR